MSQDLRDQRTQRQSQTQTHLNPSKGEHHVQTSCKPLTQPLTTEQFLAITNYNHPAVTEISSFSSVNLGFCLGQTTSHAVTTPRPCGTPKKPASANSASHGQGPARGRNQASLQPESRVVRLVIKTKQAA